MVELCLEVEGREFKQFRQDDQVHITTNVFGDTAVEIVSGNGVLITSPESRIIIGTSGDFFSNLAKSMGEVKEILGNVTDVVGVDERKSLASAQSRFGDIQSTLERMSNLATHRADATMRQLDHLGADSRESLARLQKTMDEIQPKASATTDSIGANFASIRDKVKLLRDAAESASMDTSADAKEIQTTVRGIIDRSKPNYEEMRANMRRTYDKIGGLSNKLDTMRTLAGQAMTQSEEDLVRAQEAVANSLFNFKVIEVRANENKDLMIANKDEGEFAANTVAAVYHSINASVHRLNQIRADIYEAAERARKLDPKSNIMDEADEVGQKLGVIRDGLEFVRMHAEEKMLPAFERKKSAWPE